MKKALVAVGVTAVAIVSLLALLTSSAPKLDDFDIEFDDDF